MEQVQNEVKKELTLEEIQQGAFKVLCKIDDICSKEGINYTLFYGTLIGCIRHNGFIPWDDDIDIAMTRENYERFVQYCIDHKEELKPFELMHYKTNPKYIYPIGRMSDSRYEIKDDFSKECGLGLFVDIYPYDGCPDPEKTLAATRKTTKKIFRAGTRKMTKTGNVLKDILKFPLWLTSRFTNVNKAIQKDDEKCKLNKVEGSKYVACIVWDGTDGYFEKEVFDSYTTHEFNGRKFQIIKDYDKVLTETYGSYMELPPEKDRIPHHYYKAFKK